MLNIAAINEELNKRPLCGHALIAQRGMAVEYCAMGALFKGIGVTDKELRDSDVGGVTLFSKYREQIREKYGIEDYITFSSLMNANDGDDSSVTRNETVIKHVESLTPEEVNKLIEKPVSAEL